MNRIEFVLVLIFTFFVIVVWITSDIILVHPQTPDDPKLQTMLEPINPNFDAKTIELVNNLKPQPLPKRATPLPTPLPSPSSRPTPTPVPLTTPQPATSSANLFGNNLTTASSSDSATLNPSPLTIP